jgi:hypothetical protein
MAYAVGRKAEDVVKAGLRLGGPALNAYVALE